MSEAATPLPAPAPGANADAMAAAIVNHLGGEDTPQREADTPGPGDDEGRTAAAEPANPTPGEPSTTTDPGQQATETPPTYRVKVRGEEREVPLPELLAGYSRTEDYKAKTAEIAEQRRAVEAKQAELTGRAQQFDALLAQAPHDPVLAEAQTIDWNRLAQEDPAAYVAKQQAVMDRRAYWQRVAQENRTAQAARLEMQVSQNHARLSEALPEWADDAKRPEMAAKLTATLKDYGFAPEELAAITDHRALLVTRDAMRWREHQANLKAAEAKRTAPPARPVMPPGAAQERQGPNDHARRLINRARQTRRTSDQVAAVVASLE